MCAMCIKRRCLCDAGASTRVETWQCSRDSSSTSSNNSSTRWCQQTLSISSPRILFHFILHYRPSRVHVACHTFASLYMMNSSCFLYTFLVCRTSGAMFAWLTSLCTEQWSFSSLSLPLARKTPNNYLLIHFPYIGWERAR